MKKNNYVILEKLKTNKFLGIRDENLIKIVFF